MPDERRSETEHGWVVPTDHEREINELLRFDSPTREWSLIDWAARKTWIDARFRARTGQLALVRLLPPGRSPPVEHRRTERFTIALLRGPSSLLPELEVRIREHERKFEWRRLGDDVPPLPPARPTQELARELDVETLGFFAGVKPALRRRSAPDAVWWTAWLMHRQGAAVAVLPEAMPGSNGSASLMIARTLADAEAMARAQFFEQVEDCEANVTGTRELGRRLGYPSCCIEAFIADFELEILPDASGDPLGRSVEAIIADLDVWRRLDRAWVPRPAPRLNSLLFGEQLAVISFDPCRFDCAQAQATADALFEAAARESPEAAATLERLLARPVVVDEHNRRAWIELERDIAGVERIARVEAIRLESQAPARGGLDELLLGQRVDELGRLPDLPAPRARVFRFDLGHCPR